MSASFTSLGHVFYAKHDNQRDRAKMDPRRVAQPSERPHHCAAAMVRRYRGMMKTCWGRVSGYPLAASAHVAARLGWLPTRAAA
jgi:hypothetical protein